MRFPALSLAATCTVLSITLAGCSTVAEKTNILSDDSIKSKVAGTLGHDPATLTLVNRRTDGTNTYVTVRTQNKKEFACTLNGGNLLTAGIVNPPSCTPKA